MIEQTDSTMMSESDYIVNKNKNLSSIRLSALNDVVRDKVTKFDVAGDGALDINEAMHGLITLQKQSNNYKRMLYIILPVFCIALACVFGMTVLAIQITKDTKVSADGSLSTMSGKTVSTYTNVQFFAGTQVLANQPSSVLPETVNLGSITLQVQAIYIPNTNVSHTLTPFGVLTNDKNAGSSFVPYAGFAAHPVIIDIQQYLVTRAAKIQALADDRFKAINATVSSKMAAGDAEMVRAEYKAIRDELIVSHHNSMMRDALTPAQIRDNAKAVCEATISSCLKPWWFFTHNAKCKSDDNNCVYKANMDYTYRTSTGPRDDEDVGI